MLLAGLITLVQAYGQDLNPTVEVTNTYKTGTGETVKPYQVMQVPDSVTRFELDFDYSVFEKPYKGAYEFNPYLITMKPQAKGYDGSAFKLSAGMGYTFHPELDLVWTPRLSEGWSMNFHAKNRTYFGNYHRIGAVSDGSTGIALTSSGNVWSGIESRTAAGVDFGYNWLGGEASFHADYKLSAVKDPWMQRLHHTADVGMSVKSLPSSGDRFIYDVSAGYKFGKDPWVGEHRIKLDAGAGPRILENSAIIADLGFDFTSLSGSLDAWAGNVSIAPHYCINEEDWSLKAGVKVSVNFRDKGAAASLYPSAGQLFYASVHGQYRINDNLVAVADVTGGDRISSYSEIVGSNPHFYSGYAFTGALLDYDVERVGISAGVQGKWPDKLQVSFKGGYSIVANGMLDSVVPTTVIPSVTYSGYGLISADLVLHWMTPHFVADGALGFRSASISGDGIAPPMFSGDFRALYIWHSRIRGGLNLSFATDRKGMAGTVPVTIPWWIDPGLELEYAFSDKTSAWIKSGNLIGMTIQRIPCFAQKGPWITAGISLLF